jgi:hypothetical protein
MLEHVGPEDRPIGIHVRPPGKSWANAPIQYVANEPEVLTALDDLIRAIDRLG